MDASDEPSPDARLVKNVEEHFVPRSLHYEIDHSLETHEGETTQSLEQPDERAEEEDILQKVHQPFALEESKVEESIDETKAVENEDLVEVTSPGEETSLEST